MYLYVLRFHNLVHDSGAQQHRETEIYKIEMIIIFFLYYNKQMSN